MRSKFPASHVAHLEDLFASDGTAITRKIRVPLRYRWKDLLWAAAEWLMYAIVLAVALAVIALTQASCAATPISNPVAGAISRQCTWPTVLYCDPSLSPRACSALEDAATWWNTQLETPVSFFHLGGIRPAPTEFPPNGEVYVGAVPLEARGRVNGTPTAAAQTRFHVYTDTQCRHDAIVVQFVADDDVTDGSLTQMFKHELGHVLGIPHTDMPDCVMNPVHDSTRAESAAKLCPAELNLLRALYE